MPAFGAASAAQLSTCHWKLQAVFSEVIKQFDCKILEGHRGEAAQNKAFAEGKSQKRWPDGNHNKLPSTALDAIPYPIDWGDRERMSFFAGVVIATARSKGIRLRWGGDWNSDTQVKDNRFDDLVHFELVDP